MFREDFWEVSVCNTHFSADRSEWVWGLGVLAIWKYIADPLGLYLLTEETRNLLFFPSFTVFAATLVLLAFRSDDTWSLDARMGW